jgi:hypothetical protein
MPCAVYARSTSTVAPETSGTWTSGHSPFRDALAEIGVTNVACELFDAPHGAIDYRYPRGLAYLAERLTRDP